MIGIKVSFDAPNAGKLGKELFSDDVLIFFGQEAARQMTPYVPYDQGPLSKNYVVTKDDIVYKMPYAHRQFNGDGFNFSKDMHPLATAHWDKAMMAARKDRLTKAVEDYIRSRK